MRKRWWYLFFLVIPLSMEMNNERAGGDFGIAFVLGLTISLLIIGIIEVVRFGIKLIRRA